MANTVLLSTIFKKQTLKVILIPAIDTCISSSSDDPSYDIEIDDVPAARGINANEAVVKLCKLLAIS
ncbi:MAG: hypothetical protein ACD_84C00042G0007 [uncultured bacterium]|nr:MAG: hypothetical protein ACD_84C00042G0007 [uncultured bacterium]